MVIEYLIFQKGTDNYFTREESITRMPADEPAADLTARDASF